MSYNLFLDDERNPIDVYGYTNNRIYMDMDWVIVRNYDDFIKTITYKGIPNAVSFDHDLGSKNDTYNQFTDKTGHDCAKWLINYSLDNFSDLPKKILIHSQNLEGGKNVLSLFNTFYKLYGDNEKK